MTMKVSKNYKREEYSCKCGCGFMAVDITLITIAQLLRDKYGSGTVRSGCRCKKHNDETKNSNPNSFHVLGMAVDLSFKSGNVHEWAREIEVMGFMEWVQVVKYEEDNFCHIEIDYR